MLTNLIMVALGGGLGAAARFGAGLLVTRGLGWPSFWATFGVNILGSFAIGVAFYLLIGPKGTTPGAPFIITGFLGGFTTFSAYSLDAMQLFLEGRIATAGLYVLGSVLFSLIAVALGYGLARAGWGA